MRHSPQLLAVLRALKASPVPMSAQALVGALKRHGVGRSTIFRHLEALQSNGEIVAIENSDGRKKYVGHAWHEADFCCVRCGKKRHMKHRTLPGYVDRKMFGHQRIMVSQLTAQGLCGACARQERG